MNIPPITRVLAYENDAVVRQFCADYPEFSVEEAQQIFKDLLAWLWLGEHRLQRQLSSHMIVPLVDLDKMWHIFITHTRPYSDFCLQYFNRYLHHEAEPAGAEYHVSSAELTAYLEDCYEHLGEGWLTRSFVKILSS